MSSLYYKEDKNMTNLTEGKQLDNPSRLDMAKLNIACEFFSLITGVDAMVEDIWLDFGARIWYKQIVIYNRSSSFQISPNDRERIFKATSDEEIEQAVRSAIEGYPDLYTARED